MPPREPSSNSTFVSRIIEHKHKLDLSLNNGSITKQEYMNVLVYFGIDRQSLIMYWVSNLNFHQQKLVYARKQ